jgi:predicted nucleic acid-binding protein
VYLLDTNVVSELRKQRPNARVLSWMERADEGHLFLSAVTIGEIQAGIEITRKQDGAKVVELERWLDRVAESYNVLPMDAKCFRRWATLMDRQSNTLYEDAMIAATALIHRLTVVTRNTKDFARFDVQTLNPFD